MFFLYYFFYGTESLLKFHGFTIPKSTRLAGVLEERPLAPLRNAVANIGQFLQSSLGAFSRRYSFFIPRRRGEH